MADINTSSYERMTVVELRALATTREIPFTTKTRKPELVAAHQEYGVKLVEAQKLLSNPETGPKIDEAFFNTARSEEGDCLSGQMYVAPLGTTKEEMFTEADARAQDEYITDDWDKSSATSKTLKLDPLQMRLNYARQNTRNPNLSLAESWDVALTPRQKRAIRKKNHLFFTGKATEADFKKVSA